MPTPLDAARLTELGKKFTDGSEDPPRVTARQAAEIIESGILWHRGRLTQWQRGFKAEAPDTPIGRDLARLLVVAAAALTTAEQHYQDGLAAKQQREEQARTDAERAVQEAAWADQQAAERRRAGEELLAEADAKRHQALAILEH